MSSVTSYQRLLQTKVGANDQSISDRYTPIQDGGRFPFWYTHNVPWMDFIFPANGAIIRSDNTEIMRFYDFSDLTGKFLFTAVWTVIGQLLGHNSRGRWTNVDPQRTCSRFSGFFYLRGTFRENRSRSETVKVRTDRWTDRNTRKIICPMR